MDGIVGRAAEETQQAPVALEEAAQRPGHGEGVVPVRHRGEDLLDELLGEGGGALGLA